MWVLPRGTHGQRGTIRWIIDDAARLRNGGCMESPHYVTITSINIVTRLQNEAARVENNAAANVSKRRQRTPTSKCPAAIFQNSSRTHEGQKREGN